MRNNDSYSRHISRRRSAHWSDKAERKQPSRRYGGITVDESHQGTIMKLGRILRTPLWSTYILPDYASSLAIPIPACEMQVKPSGSYFRSMYHRNETNRPVPTASLPHSGKGHGNARLAFSPTDNIHIDAFLAKQYEFIIRRQRILAVKSFFTDDSIIVFHEPCMYGILFIFFSFTIRKGFSATLQRYSRGGKQQHLASSYEQRERQNNSRHDKHYFSGLSDNSVLYRKTNECRFCSNNKKVLQEQARQARSCRTI